MKVTEDKMKKGENGHMNQPIGETQKDTEKMKTRNWSGQKKQAVAAVVIALIAMAVVPILAWFYYQRSMQTITKINAPNPMQIGAGNAQAIKELELNDIDVTVTPKYKDVVFCVYSQNPCTYNLQLAHTTNIGFTYTIYPAKRDISGGSTEVPYLNKTYYFSKTNRVQGNYLNQAADSGSARANTSGIYHDTTYAKSDGTAGSYDKVQPFAEPLYWQANKNTLQLTTSDDTGVYINYFVLRIEWDDSFRNNKETDMVYLMAEAAAS